MAIGKEVESDMALEEVPGAGGDEGKEENHNGEEVAGAEEEDEP